MTPKFQIFLSSTFEDLKEARRVVMEQILNLGHIPVGMELFQAGNDSQWDYIKRRITECDYYLLVVGDRYGSCLPDGMSYTEREYRFAIDQSVPVASFLLSREARMKLPRTHIETDREKVERLEQFRGLVQTRMVQFWSEQYELAAKISSALPALITSHPRPGLVPATIAGAPDPPRSTIQKNGTTEKVTLKAGQTQDAFDGQVFISLIGTSFEGDPLRYKVTATVGGPGAKPVSIAKQDIGFTIRFKQFDVRVLESGTFAATFAITE